MGKWNAPSLFNITANLELAMRQLNTSQYDMVANIRPDIPKIPNIPNYPNAEVLTNEYMQSYRILAALSAFSSRSASLNASAVSAFSSMIGAVVVVAELAVTPDIPQTWSPRFRATSVKTVIEMKHDMNLLMNHPNANLPDRRRNILLSTKV